MSILRDVDLATRVRRCPRRHVRRRGPWNLGRAFAGDAIPVARSLWRTVRLRFHFCSRRERKLPSDDDCFARFDSIFDDPEIAVLSLTRFDPTKIGRVVPLDHKNERAALTDLHSLRWDESRIFDRVEDETNSHEF